MKLLKSSLMFSFGTVLSRIMGLLRDMILASTFGASVFMDAFFVAYRIPNLFREMLAEGALAGAFTKVYVYLNERNKEEASQFLLDALLLVFLMGSGICLLGIIFAPSIVELMTMLRGEASGSDLIIQATGLTRVLFPFLTIMMIGSVAMGALHQWGRFFLSAFAPVNFNLGYILGIVAIGPMFESMFGETVSFLQTNSKVTGVAVGVIIGGLGQVSFYFLGLWKKALKGVKARPRWRLNEHTKRLFRIMLPASLAASTGPINLVVNTNFATSLPEGSVTWLNYAFRLFQLPIGVFGVALSVVVLPALSRSIANSNDQVDSKASEILQRAMGLTFWAMIPCWAFLSLAGQDIVALLFQRGSFSAVDAQMTSNALLVYATGLIGYALIKVLTSFYFAVERTAYALKISIVCILVNFSANYYFVKILGYDHVGLALTSASVLSINAFLLFTGLFYSGVRFEWKKAIKKAIVFTFLTYIPFAILIHFQGAIIDGQSGLIMLISNILIKAVIIFGPFGLSFYLFHRLKL